MVSILKFFSPKKQTARKEVGEVGGTGLQPTTDIINWTTVDSIVSDTFDLMAKDQETESNDNHERTTEEILAEMREYLRKRKSS